MLDDERGGEMSETTKIVLGFINLTTLTIITVMTYKLLVNGISKIWNKITKNSYKDELLNLSYKITNLENEVNRLGTKNKYRVILKDGTTHEINDVYKVSGDFVRSSDYLGFTLAEDRVFYNKDMEIIAKFKSKDIEKYYEIKDRTHEDTSL